MIFILSINGSINSFFFFSPQQQYCPYVMANELHTIENSSEEPVENGQIFDQIQPYRKDICHGAKNNGELIQSFKPNLNKLTKLYLFGWQNGNAPGDLNISIRDSLHGIHLSYVSVDPSIIPIGRNNADWFEIDIPDITVCPNSTYYIVWKPNFDNKAISYYWWFDYYRSPNLPENDAYKKGKEYRQGEEYPLNDFCFKTYGYSIPTINITKPSMNDETYGKTKIYGNAYDTDGTVKKVEIKIDNNDWIIVNGTNDWVFEWDTAEEKNGVHTVYVRSDDGQSYSNIKSIMVFVNNTQLKIKWISGGTRRILTEIENNGAVDAYNVSCSIILTNILTGKIIIHSVDNFSILNPGVGEKIMSKEIPKSFSIVSLLLTVDANNAYSLIWKTYGVVLGKFIFLI